ncbi:MAG: hypothetical protein IKM06_07110 [Clostridia bacterium]|nr:hypothetical protein [Clostridia bacterium]
MSSFTYEYEKRNHSLETYEWDNVWLEHADTNGVPRVLYIGDSISCATRIASTKAANNEIFFDGFGTSKAVDNPYFTDSVRLFAAQQGERRVILFNNGLHGWHLEDTTEYKEGYERILQFLIKEFEGTPLVILLTTHVSDDERDKRVVKRNQAALELAKKYDLPVVDLYSITKEHADTITDGVHLNGEGYGYLAEAIVKKVRELF